jgi:hypothetical protein
MANKYTTNESSEKTQPSEEDMLLRVMQEEFPDDVLFKNGELSQLKATLIAGSLGARKSPIARNILDRNENGILSVMPKSQHTMLDGTIMAGPEHGEAVKGSETLITEFVQYNLTKSFPTVDAEELDEFIDEEWEYFEDADDEEDIQIIVKGESGLFLTSRSTTLRDMHDLYIQEGPELILELNHDELDQITDLFCVFYTENGVAYPIPNYKTLEVMLVENGVRYDSIRMATDDQFKVFDLIMEGDEDSDISPIDEFRTRLGYGVVKDRSQEWTPDLRFRSGYEVRAPFKRDPGEYIKPIAIRGKNISTSALGPRIDLYQQEDIEDLYFDQVFLGQTTREKFREQYEGKMIILDWPMQYPDGQENPGVYSSKDITRDTDVQYDDAVWGLRMMINGHWKQVRDQYVMRLYAELNPTLMDKQGNMALTNYHQEGRYGVNGLINLLIKAGGITVVNDNIDTAEISDDGKNDPLWSLFSHIVEADGADIFADAEDAANNGHRPDGRAGLDKIEYIEYLDNYTNGGNPFNVVAINPYEPKGSVKYYDQNQYKSLIQEAIYQGQIDTIKDDILEIFPGTAALVQETRALFNTLPDNYNQYVTDKLGKNSPMYKVMRSDDPWKFVKKKNGIKSVDGRHNIFKLFMKNWRMRWSMNESVENQIVSNGGRHWMKTIARDQFEDRIVKAASWNAGIFFMINPLAGIGALSVYGTAKMMNVLIGSVAHGKTDRLPPWQFMDDDWYLRACIAEYWMPQVEEMYNRSIEIDTSWIEITNYVDAAEGVIEEFDQNLIKARNLEDFQELLDSLQAIDDAIRDDDMIDLINRADQIRDDVDAYLRTALLNQYRAIEYMRSEIHNGMGKRKKFGIAWPPSVQRIMNKHVYGQTLTFNKNIPKK